jgi:hypothetical protein
MADVADALQGRKIEVKSHVPETGLIAVIQRDGLGTRNIESSRHQFLGSENGFSVP